MATTLTYFFILKLTLSIAMGDDCSTFIPGISCDPNTIKFYLFPNPNNTSDFDELVYSDSASVAASRFASSKKLILITHGFTQTSQTAAQVLIKNAYLSNGFAVGTNIVLVDWGQLSGAYASTPDIILVDTIALLPQYIAAVNNVPIVGQRISDFLVFLSMFSTDLGNRTHLVGQSLGAHAIGHAGTQFQKSTGTSLQRVTGTDPAGPLYSFPFKSLFRNGVATFVDAVHTNRGGFGSTEFLADVDFLVNGGGPLPQPGCLANITDLFCSHNKAIYYYTKSIGNKLIATMSNVTQITLTLFGEFCPPTSERGVYSILISN